MLTIKLPATDEFEAVELHFEHSLVSLSKWEAIHEKSFYEREEIDNQGTLSYIEQMLLDDPPHEDWVTRLGETEFKLIGAYINSKQSATWFNNVPGSSPPGPKEVITAELIYFWMISFQIPFQPCETWHLNRLMTLVRICGIKQSKPKKMTRQQQAEEYRRLNEARRSATGSSG
jgi:hypothetical protein